MVGVLRSSGMNVLNSALTVQKMSGGFNKI